MMATAAAAAAAAEEAVIWHCPKLFEKLNCLIFVGKSASKALVLLNSYAPIFFWGG